MLTEPLYQSKHTDTRYTALKSSSIREPGFESHAHISDFPGMLRSFDRNALIYAENDPATCFYRVVVGAVRSSKVLFDGRRQIAAFYLPGQAFGVELCANRIFSTEAIVSSKLMVMRRNTLHSEHQDPDLLHRLYTMADGELQRAQHRLTLLAKTAQERVATFLLDLNDCGAPGDLLQIPMPRQDIADYLGLTMETVSRVLSQLQDAALISIPTCKQIVLRNRSALRRRAG